MKALTYNQARYSNDNDVVSLKERVILWLVPIIGVLIVLNSAAALAANERAVFSEPAGYGIHTPSSARWGFSYENDFLVPGSNDRDYTFGAALSYSSRDLRSTSQAADTFLTPLSVIDKLLGFKSPVWRSGVEAGLYGFTPTDVSEQQVNQDDRPFSSLVYFSGSNERLNLEEQTVVRTQLTVGALGLSLVGKVQETVHAVIDSEQPRGWDNQISNGGELTARYAISKQRLLPISSRHFELRETRSISLGYLTEATWGLSFRAGNLSSSWHEFNPDTASYAESSASVNPHKRERFFWAGAAIKARAYNTFLQGQFRDSAHTYSSSEVRHAVLELWAGYTQSFSNGYFVSYGLRAHSSEVRDGTADRNVAWGGLTLGKKVL